MGWYLRRPDGSELDLTGNGYYAVQGVSGAWWTPVQYATQRAPRGGDLVLDTHYTGRAVDVPVFVRAAGGAPLSGAVAKLMAYLSTDPERPSTLIWRGVEERQLDVLLRGGGVWTDAQRGRDFVRVVLPLYAPEPFWRAAAATSVILATVQGVPFLPDFPFQLTASGVYAQQVITIDGVGAFPVWSIIGPVASITITNQTTGEHWTLENLNLVSNEETAIVDTNPQAIMRGESIRVTRIGQGEENGWRYMTSDSVLWNFVAGNNNVLVEASGTDANTSVEVTYYTRYAGPWTESEP